MHRRHSWPLRIALRSIEIRQPGTGLAADYAMKLNFVEFTSALAASERRNGSTSISDHKFHRKFPSDCKRASTATM
jgi:hypothetical protein